MSTITKKQRKASRTFNALHAVNKQTFKATQAEQNARDLKNMAAGRYIPPKATNKTKTRVFAKKG